MSHGDATQQGKLKIPGIGTEQQVIMLQTDTALYVGSPVSAGEISGPPHFMLNVRGGSLVTIVPPETVEKLAAAGMIRFEKPGSSPAPAPGIIPG